MLATDAGVRRVKIYVVLPDDAADAIALWVLHTWLAERVHVFRRALAVTSPTKGCGKTTVLRLLNKAGPPAEAGWAAFHRRHCFVA